MRFSIVIPAYNYGRLLPRALESALAQGGDDYEILVIDDGSTDATPEVVEGLLQRYRGRFRYLRQENRGLAAVRNRGIDETTGEYLLFLDADDRLLPDALEKFRAFFRRRGSWGMICGGHISVHPDGRERHHPMANLSADRRVNFRRYIRKKFGISNGATAMARQIFTDIRYPEQLRNSEDIPVFARVLALYDCVSLPEPVLEIHKHDDSLRNNLPMILRSGPQLADILFDPKILPGEFMRFRREFEARQHLSQFRALYLARRFSEAKREYSKAIHLYPAAVADVSHLRKYLRILVKS